jgi:hypothetical protein
VRWQLARFPLSARADRISPIPIILDSGALEVIAENAIRHGER